jgi:hypothetical protein
MTAATRKPPSACRHTTTTVIHVKPWRQGRERERERQGREREM